jgi:hypothetical protein
MARQIKGLLYFLMMNLRNSLLIFWTILLGILVVSLTFAYFLSGIEGTNFVFFLTVPIYVYCSIIGIFLVRDSIPFAIKMGATRKNMFIAFGTFFLVLSILKSAIATVLEELVYIFNEFAGIDIFTFLHFAHLLENNWYTRMIIDSAMMFFSFVLFFMVGLLFYKFGLAVSGSVLGVFAVLLLLGIARGWIFDFFRDLFSAFEIGLFYQLFGIALIIYLLTFVFLRRMEVK